MATAVATFSPNYTRVEAKHCVDEMTIGSRQNKNKQIRCIFKHTLISSAMLLGNLIHERRMSLG